jgi:glycosyltransferase involved in cell wall biosynthesis
LEGIKVFAKLFDKPQFIRKSFLKARGCKKTLKPINKISVLSYVLCFCFAIPIFAIKVSADQPPLVSVIIPVYKAEKTIDRCLQSVIAQTLKDIEIICVNDGSPDRSRSILEKYASNDSRIKIINKTNGGASSARNEGLDAATGEYTGFVDSDDYIDERAFEMAYSTATKYQADVVTFGAWCVEEDTGKEWYWGPPKTYYFDGNGATSFLDPDGYYSVIWNKIFRTDIIRSNNIRFRLDMRNKEDTVFVLELIPYVKNAVSLHESFYTQHRSSEGLNKTAKPNLMLKATRIQAEQFARTWKHPDLQMFRFLAENIYQQWLNWAMHKHLPQVGCTSAAVRELETYCRTLMHD